MKATHIIPMCLLALVAMAGAQSADAATCKNVKFNVTNNHFEGREIKILKVEFRNPHRNGARQTENVKDLICRHGATCLTGGDNLKNAGKVDLYDIKVIFRYREHDEDWSGKFKTRPFTPKFRKCTENKKYGPIVVTDSA